MIRPWSLGGALPRLAALGTSVAMLLSLAPLAPTARAVTVITVDTTAQEINSNAACSLQEAIYSANLDANLAPDPANPGGIDFVTTGCARATGLTRSCCRREPSSRSRRRLMRLTTPSVRPARR